MTGKFRIRHPGSSISQLRRKDGPEPRPRRCAKKADKLCLTLLSLVTGPYGGLHSPFIALNPIKPVFGSQGCIESAGSLRMRYKSRPLHRMSWQPADSRLFARALRRPPSDERTSGAWALTRKSPSTLPGGRAFACLRRLTAARSPSSASLRGSWPQQPPRHGPARCAGCHAARRTRGSRGSAAGSARAGRRRLPPGPF